MLKQELYIKRLSNQNDELNTVSFVASTENADRMSDVISQKGWSLDAYRRNPIVLFNHNSQALPIGRGEVAVVDDQLMIEVTFDPDDELAQKIAKKVQNGFMNAVSVGFNALQAYNRSDLPTDHKHYSTGGTYFEKAELLEVSIVTIPANSEAIAAKNFDQSSILKTLSTMVLKHIIEVVENDDSYSVLFEKHKPQDQPEDKNLLNDQLIKNKSSEFEDLPVTDELFNSKSSSMVEIEDSILGEDDWDRYAKAHLVKRPDMDPDTKAAYGFIIGRLRDPDDPENPAPEKGNLYVYRDKLADAVAALNGSRSKPNLTEEERQDAYNVASKYYDKLGLEIPPLKELSYEDPEEDEDEDTEDLEEENDELNKALLLEILTLKGENHE